MQEKQLERKNGNGVFRKSEMSLSHLKYRYQVGITVYKSGDQGKKHRDGCVEG